ncbi:MAG: hypothetical protein K2N06_02250 [Oscillospiraceae bacterium]|nr:hypothetical protein [Oscillospiraceae bacterium]
MNFKLFSMEDFRELSESGGSLYDLCEFLRLNKSEIAARTDKFTLEDLYYSEYYQLHSLIKERDLQNDPGAKQQLFQAIEGMDFEIEIDWDIIREIDENFGFKDE